MPVRLILGTAGHVDHGKTALVRALTGVDTDRLREEKERGLTVDLGFAELPMDDDVVYGLVDVPGHEGFVRNMVAGATGMDVVLLVVAADEGVMPQTREHLDIVRLLDAGRLIVALTKADLVEEDWLSLVREEVAEVLQGTPHEGAPAVATSVVDGRGLEELREILRVLAGKVAHRRSPADLARMPLDRVFTVRGTGTVVTGSLWSGVLRPGDGVRILPGGPEARVRGLQVHGRPASEARGGQRVAAALAGPDVDRRCLERGQVLVRGDEGWRESFMLTARLRVLARPGWSIEQGQRVRVHHGTAEVMARTALLGRDELVPGTEDWVQLRLEAPVVARAGDRLVIRSYSPVTTIAGGVVAEPAPRRRSRLEAGEVDLLEAVLAGGGRALTGALALAGEEGVSEAELPVRTGIPPTEVKGLLKRDPEVIRAGDRVFPGALRKRARGVLVREVESFHRARPLSPGMPLELLRQRAPGRSSALADVLIGELVEEGRLHLEGAAAAVPSFELRPSPDQEEALESLREVYREAGTAPPRLQDLPESLQQRGDLPALLRLLERDGTLLTLDEGLFVWSAAAREAGRRVQEAFGGRTGLAPSDFREVLSVSRKHLIPLLSHFDGRGLTIRRPGGRDVVPDE